MLLIYESVFVLQCKDTILYYRFAALQPAVPGLRMMFVT